MRLTSVVSGALLVMVLALTGCGGDDPEGDAGSEETSDAPSSDDAGNTDVTPAEESSEPEESGDLDVCGLLSAADLEGVFTSPFDDGEATHQEQTGGDQCVWTNTDAPPIKVFSITVLREGHLSDTFEQGGITVESLHDNTKAAMPNVEDVDLGDDAYLSGSTLAVLNGDTGYTFSTVLGTSPEAIDGMKTLAEQVVG